MNFIFLFILSVLCVYTIIPTFVVRFFGIGVYKKNGRGIALTFDDGPDPQYTPQLLDLLKRYKIKATFFVLGSKAEKYPEIVVRMHEEGHLVGVHNYLHWANALMTPKRVRSQLNHSVNLIESIIGERPVYYRPPWGIINIFDFLLMKHFRMILWSNIVGDWRSHVGKRKIKQRLLSKLRDGSIIVLHDSGQTLGANKDAPMHMLEALQEFISESLSKGYFFLRVDEPMSPYRHAVNVKSTMKKRFFIYLWFKWDQLFHVLFRVKPVKLENPFLFYRVRPYHGKSFLLSDGEEILQGDSIIELHFNNEMLFRMAAGSRSSVQLAVQLIRTVKESLPQITAIISNDPKYNHIKAIYGITFIHRGADQLGFTLMSLPHGWFSFATRMYLKALLYGIHSEGKTRLKSDHLIPKVLAMSAQELKKRYPAHSNH